MATAQDQKTAADFTSYYLQQSTKEFAEDLDKIRSADDFKGDALPMLIKSLRQGTSMFSAGDQKRIVDARQASAAEKGSDSEEENRHGRYYRRHVENEAQGDFRGDVVAEYGSDFFADDALEGISNVDRVSRGRNSSL
ncbi:ribosome-assembly protein 3-domain-containing protein [Nemania sp. FL0031]|nr:ribosome-assembly protein 3-domain-containing protein [Nemania sp. FL0031]